MIEGLHHIAIICSDRCSVKFYETLGFHIRENHIRPQCHDEIIFMDGNGITLELFIDDTHPARLTKPEANGLRHLALRVTEIEKVLDEIRAAGYMPEAIRNDSFNGRKMAFVKDPDGLPIELHE